MTKLDQILKTKAGDKLFCVELNNATVKRIELRKVHQLVKDGVGTYCSKSKWKAQRPAKAVKKDDVAEKKKVVHGLKAKDRKAADKK